MNVKLLSVHHLEHLSLKGGCKGSSEFTLVKTPHCWKSHISDHIFDIGQFGAILYILNFKINVSVDRLGFKFYRCVLP